MQRNRPWGFLEFFPFHVGGGEACIERVKVVGKFGDPDVLQGLGLGFLDRSAIFEEGRAMAWRICSLEELGHWNVAGA